MPFILFVFILMFSYPIYSLSYDAMTIVLPEDKEKISFEGFITQIENKQIIYIGEQHNQPSHQQVQLAIIQALYEKNQNLSIGVEFFQQPFQNILNQYINQEIDEKTLLKESEYFSRWGFDFRQYAPILAFAKENAIPILALNIPSEITRKVAKKGLDALTLAEKSLWAYDIALPSKAYQKRLQVIFEQHPTTSSSFENFVYAQVLWDENMARQVVAYLKAYPEKQLVVIAGNGHIISNETIADRVNIKFPTDFAIVENAIEMPDDFEISDFVVITSEIELANKAKLGAFLEEKVVIQSLLEGSIGKKLGLQAGDIILSIDNTEIHEIEDIFILLWDKTMGDSITLEILRNNIKQTILINF